MAFFDFLGQGVGGMTPPVTTGDEFSSSGSAVTTPSKPIGPTYGDISKAALQYGSKPGSSGPAFASMMPQSGWQQNLITPLIPNAPKQLKTQTGQETDGQDDTLAKVAQWFMSLLGGGV